MLLDFGLFTKCLKLWESGAWRGMTIMSARGIYRSQLTSFLVNAKSLNKYYRLIEGKYSIGMPLDLHLQTLIRSGQLSAYLCVPFLSSQSAHAERSEIRATPADLSCAVANIYSRALFADADHEQLANELSRLTRDAKIPMLAKLYLGTLAFTLSDQYKPF
jgi:hypothetical protein